LRFQKQRNLFDLPMSHHYLQFHQLDILNHRYLCAAFAAFSEHRLLPQVNRVGASSKSRIAITVSRCSF